MGIVTTEGEYRRQVESQPDDNWRHDALYQADQRIAALEKQCAVLAAEIDLLRPVITAVHGHRHRRQNGWNNSVADQVLHDAYDTYQAAKEQG